MLHSPPPPPPPTHTHTQRGSNSKSLFREVINDDTGICIASTGLKSKMRGMGGGGVISCLIQLCVERERERERERREREREREPETCPS